MEYILLNKIKIERSILFLCGPYYSDAPSDRRYQLKKFISRTFNNRYLPLILDHFLTEENINDDKITLHLMEEICASISEQTYIFLDTISSAAELGIFVNKSISNKIKVYLPSYSDILNKNNVGYFVKNGIIRDKSNSIEFIEYRPKIERYAIASDFVVEHYGFINDSIPEVIANDIINDFPPSLERTHDISVSDSPSMPPSWFDVNYSIVKDQLFIKTSIKLLFYTTIAILRLEYKDTKSSDFKFDKINISQVTSFVKDAYKNLIGEYTNIDLYKDENISIETILAVSLHDLIYHISKFYHIYTTVSVINNTFLLTNPLGSVLKFEDIGINSNSIFKLLDDEINTLKDIISNKEKYYEEKIFNTGSKKRNIICYKTDESGSKVKKIHRKVLNEFQKRYMPHICSFAYQKNRSIKTCVMQHINSNMFFKFDLQKFFNSIKIDMLIPLFIKEFNIDIRSIETVKLFFKTCFIDNKLPLGLILSPVLSDIYMKDFDGILALFCSERSLIYTRYADDILISSKNEMSTQLASDLETLIIDSLDNLKLKLNNEKRLSINFNSKHTYIRFLGINIIKGERGNFLSVGKKYINKIAKEYLEYLSYPDESKEAFYNRLRLIGQIDFVKQIEGEVGYKRIETRLRKHIPLIDI